jgi:hypothetical protein
VRASIFACLTVFALLIPWSTAPAQAVPDSIAADGVPEIPGALIEQLGRYQHTRSASFQGWLADRREMLILTRFGDTNQVHRVAFPGGDQIGRAHV